MVEFLRTRGIKYDTVSCVVTMIREDFSREAVSTRQGAPYLVHIRAYL